jgi:hypothetical protein
MSVTGEGWDPATTGYTGGRATIDPNMSSGRGRWDFVMEGCQPYQGIGTPCEIVSPGISVVYEKIDDPVEEEPLACDARLPELPSGQSALLLDVHGSCEQSRFGYYVAVIQERCLRTPCADNGSLYGLVEAVQADKYRSFDEYEADFRRRNGDRVYAFESQTNEHTLPSGQTIKFHYFPQSPTAWAISSSSDAALNALAAQDMSVWPRAQGPIVESDGAGNVRIKNPRSNQSVRFDWTNVAAPRRQ